MRSLVAAACFALLYSATQTSHASPGQARTSLDSRIRSQVFDPGAVVRVPVQRGLVTQIVLSPDEQIVGSPATGRGADCSEPAHTWCVATQGGDIFLKPRTGATATNLAVTTTRRRYSFDLQPIAKGETPVIRLTMVTGPTPASAQAASAALPPEKVARPAPVSSAELVQVRMTVRPTPRNDAYSVATGEASDDIVPAMVFDDGTQTYFQFPNNRPIPTVFQIAPDGTEQTVNVRMDADDFLVADRVARRFVLRLGRSVAAVTNDAFDLDGVPPVHGTNVPGVARVTKKSNQNGVEP